MAYNHGREDRKWRIWKEAEEKLLRECGVDEATIEQIRMADRADFNSNRRFYRWTNDVAEYLEDMAGRERQAEVGTVAELLEEIESENLYQVLVTVDGRTLKIVLLKMQGYSTKEIAPLVKLPAIRFHILTSFLVGKLVVLPPLFAGQYGVFQKRRRFFEISSKIF